MIVQPVLVVAAALFSLGIYGILVRRNAVMVLLSIELILIKENNIDLYIDEINNYLNGKYTLNHEYAAQVIEENYSVKAISDKFKELYYEFI